jgi:hypothetical protein
MKTRRWIGWVVTGLMAALMLLSAVPDVLRIPGALAVFRHLGYPPYLLVLPAAIGLALMAGAYVATERDRAVPTPLRIVGPTLRGQPQPATGWVE